MDYLSARAKIESIANAEPSDIDWLFCEVLNINRSGLVLLKQIESKAYKQLVKYAKRLRRGMPLSVALGYTYFYDCKIMVNKHVLTPRPETEELCDMLIKDIKQSNKKVKVLDLCCGSGACGIAIKKARNNADVTLADISKYAIKTTKQNAKNLNANVKIIKSDMLNNITGKFDYIICNPPYIAYGDKDVQPSVHKWEPHLALYAPDNGYKYYKLLSSSVFDYLNDGGKLYLEVGHIMAKNVAALFGSNAQIKTDMQKIERFVIVTKPKLTEILC